MPVPVQPGEEAPKLVAIRCHGRGFHPSTFEPAADEARARLQSSEELGQGDRGQPVEGQAGQQIQEGSKALAIPAKGRLGSARGKALLGEELLMQGG